LSIGGNWDRRISRRTFLGMGGLSAAALVLGSKGAMSQTSGSAGYGELVPGELIDLPEDFRYRVISPEGSPLSSGGAIPGDPDGMAAFRGPFKRTSGARQRQMAAAEPPAHLAPRVSGELAEAAGRYGMSKLEAAAFASLGVPLV
jgi:uncharacterized protein